MVATHDNVDTLVIGSGVSGSFLAKELSEAGKSVLIVEAGESFDRRNFPRTELAGNGRLYWGGGIELNDDASLGLLRAKAVGGGSVVNQALVDRFDPEAWRSWRERTGLGFLDGEAMAPWYDAAESVVAIRSIPREAWNRNARIFEEGFARAGYRCAPLRRAQGDCRWEKGNDCIVCLNGCPLDSKQSMPVTALKKALEAGARLVPRCEIETVAVEGAKVVAQGRNADGSAAVFRARRLVLAAGSLGNVAILWRSGFAKRLPALGQGFYSHPQFMTFADYGEPVDAFRGPFQGLKSDEPQFRRQGFKLENVFAQPVGIAMLLPALGASHRDGMARLRHFACIEVAIRDTEAGRISLNSSGKLVVRKRLGAEDRRRRDAGLRAVDSIFRGTGAQAIHRGAFAFSLHLMGGCALGSDPKRSVVDSRFRVHGIPEITIADSSVFPDAPGINPSLTIMALSLRAAYLRKEEG